MAGDTRKLCVMILGLEHSLSAFEGADCEHCERVLLCKLCSHQSPVTLLQITYPICSAPRSSGKGPQGRNKSTASSDVLAELNMVLGPSLCP